MEIKHRFSVFTATRNRAELLPRLYNHLKNQTFKDFEWVIVNDGSDDNTEEVIQQFVADQTIDIQYIRGVGGGKHTAWRLAIPQFRGRYVIGCDDDDDVTHDMLEIHNRHWLDLEARSDYGDFAAVRTRCVDEEGKLVGNPLTTPTMDSDYLTYSFAMNQACEMASSNKVEVLRAEGNVPERFPFSEYASNLPEFIRWGRIARRYKTRFTSDVTRIYNFTPDSLVNNSRTRIINGDRRTIANALVGMYYMFTEYSDVYRAYRRRQYLAAFPRYAVMSVLYNKPMYTNGLSVAQRAVLRALWLPAILVVRLKGWQRARP